MRQNIFICIDMRSSQNPTMPSAGQRSILSQQRLHVTQCNSLLQVDPECVMGWFRKVIKQRCYNVPGPNSIWHLDSYHKLIQWGIIIHGGNKAMTVLNCFLEAIMTYNLPSRIRCDKDGESSLVSQYMLAHPARGPGWKSCITGKSVHNQQIERLWRDVYSGCICYFHELFTILEQADCLNPDDPIDILSLHYTYMPWIKQQLNILCQVWTR